MALYTTDTVLSMICSLVNWQLTDGDQKSERELLFEKFISGWLPKLLKCTSPKVWSLYNFYAF